MTDFALTCAIEKAQKYYERSIGKERHMWFDHLCMLVKIRELRLILDLQATKGGE